MLNSILLFQLIMDILRTLTILHVYLQQSTHSLVWYWIEIDAYNGNNMGVTSKHIVFMPGPGLSEISTPSSPEQSRIHHHSSCVQAVGHYEM